MWDFTTSSDKAASVMSGGGLILAVPKGRLSAQLLPLMARAGIEPEPDFHNVKTRRLTFKTNLENLTLNI